MKKKSGFTLIELLAVIVILAIIALIAVPQIMKILYEARLHAAEDATYGMIKSTENFLANQILLNDAEKSNYVFKCYKNGVCKDSVETDEDDETVYPEYILDYKGKKIIGGEINVLNNELIQVDEIIAFGFKCSKDYDEEIVHCTPLDGTEVYYNEGQTEEVVVDNNPGIICGDANVEQYDSMTECHIKSMEDWNEFKTLVNTENKNFQNKRVILDANLNFSELTFEPIGNSTKFKGTFYGNNKKLSNITINNNSDNIGIFTQNEGTIEYLKIDNATITSTGNNIGGLAGTNNGYIKGITATNLTISGSNNIGGLVGDNKKHVSNIIIDSNVTGTGRIGGVVGNNGVGASKTINILVKNTILTNTNSNSETGTVAGFENYGVGTAAIIEKANITTPGTVYTIARFGTGYLSDQVIINGEQQSGITIGNAMLPIYNTYIDTYMDGDDGDEYYFDYDKHGNVVIKNTEEDPIEFNLSGTGEESDPYIITNSKEWKQATLRSNETGAYFKITKDINFNNIPTYPMNRLAGTMIGDHHELSNVVLYGTGNNIGMIITNNGTIENLKLNNINITGNANNVGGLVGVNNGNVKGIIATNLNINGANNVGGLVGDNKKYVSDIIIDSKCTGTGRLGGVVGNNGVGASKSINIIVKNTILTNTNSNSDTGTVAGFENYGVGTAAIIEKANITTPGTVYTIARFGNGYISNQVVVNGTTQNGIIIDNEMLPIYNEYIDTYIAGDNDSNNYYFDYDNDGKIIIKNIMEDPISTNLNGEGTQESPFLISNTSDWKKAIALKDTEGKYFKITQNIDFNQQLFYPFQTFKGTLYGENHMLSNIKLYGTGNGIGPIINNSGTIEYLKLNNIKITGNANNVGGLTATNNGTIKAITAHNIDITGIVNVGGLVGDNKKSVSNVIIESKITGTGRIGGVIGNCGMAQSRSTNIIIENTELINSSSSSETGTVSGFENYGIGTVAIIEKANVNTPGTVYTVSRFGSGFASNQVIINGSQASNQTYTGDKLTFYNNYIDTDIDSTDSNDDGYYFGYDSSNNIVIKKA